jgi:hypothetical protein
MFREKVVEKIRTHILGSVTRAVFEITLKNVIEPNRPEKTK